MEWWLDEYENFVNRMNTPRVAVDNGVSATATVVKVDGARKHGVLLDVVQALTDLDLAISKGYISSDGRWFMGVFHVTDRLGRKLTDAAALSCLEHSLAADSISAAAPLRSNLTALELAGADRPGLLSEIFAVLADLNCSVVEAKAWTHNARIAALILVEDERSGSPIVADAHRVHRIESRLHHVLKGDHGARAARTTISLPVLIHPDRRLHQLMFADRDYERAASSGTASTSLPQPSVSVQNWLRGYSVVAVQCRDRPKLLFDVVCTLTDMEYVVFHGTVVTDGDRAHQELYIRHLDGSPISSEAERQRVIQCLQAAIERRASEGLRLELCTPDRRGLLADVTRTFRENGLSVTRAEITTKDQLAVNVFYVTDAAGNAADPKAINAVIQHVGTERLRVSEECWPQFCSVHDDGTATRTGAGLFYLSNMVRRNLYNLGLIRSCT